LELAYGVFPRLPHSASWLNVPLPFGFRFKKYSGEERGSAHVTSHPLESEKDAIDLGRLTDEDMGLFNALGRKFGEKGSRLMGFRNNSGMLLSDEFVIVSGNGRILVTL
jgi:hypothetical protein